MDEDVGQAREIAMRRAALIEKLIAEAPDCARDSVQSFGCTLISPMPHVAPSAFAHEVFDGVSKEETAQHALANEINIPGSFSDLLSEINGFILYGGKMSMYGIVTTFSRDPKQRRPFSLLDRNKYSRPIGSSVDHFFIGSFSSDGSLLYMLNDSQRIYKRSRDDPRVVDEWSNFDSLIDLAMSVLGPPYWKENNRRNRG